MSKKSSLRVSASAWLLMLVLVAAGAVVAAVSVTARSALRAQTNESAVQEVELRRRLAGTCEGTNLDLADAAATQSRRGNGAEASRLLAMRQNCEARPPATR
jgi:hypothetical protein